MKDLFAEPARKRILVVLEQNISKSSSVSENMEFPDWEEVKRKKVFHLDRMELKKKRKQAIQWFFGSFSLATAVLFASLFFTFWTNKSQKESLIAEVPLEIPPTPQINPLEVKIHNLTGKVICFRNGETILLSKNGQLVEGDRIVLEKNGMMELEFPEHIRIKLFPKTDVTLNKSQGSLESLAIQISLVKGQAFVRSPKLRPSDQLGFLSGGWSVEVRGTSFSIQNLKEKPTVVVLEGTVQISREETVVYLPEEFFWTSDSSETKPILDRDKKSLLEWQKSIQKAEKQALLQEFRQWDLLRLADGSTLEGVVAGQTEKELRVLTVEGEMLIPMSQILETVRLE